MKLTKNFVHSASSLHARKARLDRPEFGTTGLAYTSGYSSIRFFLSQIF